MRPSACAMRASVMRETALWPLLDAAMLPFVHNPFVTLFTFPLTFTTTTTIFAPSTPNNMNDQIKAFNVGDYASAEQIERQLPTDEYGPHAARCTYLQGDDAQWAVQTHCKGYAFSLTKAEDIRTVLLYGSEDSPAQVWGSTRVAPRVFDEFERLA